MIKSVYKSANAFIRHKKEFKRYKNIYHRYQDFTMIPQHVYCHNLCLAENHLYNLFGDVVECGVWRGGMAAGLAEIGGPNRHYFLFDSFEGLPQAKAIDGDSALAWQKNTRGDNYYNNCLAEMDYAENAMKKTGAVYFLHKGWFKETLLDFTGKNPIALLRLDADWYESTMDCLTQLYPHVCKNGLIILDDYYAWDGCSRAVHDYLSSIKSASRISVFHGICYIIKKD